METTVAIVLPKVSKEKYEEFKTIYNIGKKYRGMFMGMAFYQHFSLHKVKDQSVLNDIKTMEAGPELSKLISDLFKVA